MQKKSIVRKDRGGCTLHSPPPRKQWDLLLSPPALLLFLNAAPEELCARN